MGVGIGAADGAVVGAVVGALTLVNISANCLRALTYESPMGANCVLGCRYFRVAMRSLTASITASTEEVVGMAYSFGKNSTV